MTCPQCGGETFIINSRKTCESVRRRRERQECGYRFSTTEIEIDLLNKLTIKETKNHE
jgi:transcriptional regulator NrdR family protein